MLPERLRHRRGSGGMRQIGWLKEHVVEKVSCRCRSGRISESPTVRPQRVWTRPRSPYRELQVDAKQDGSVAGGFGGFGGHGAEAHDHVVP